MRLVKVMYCIVHLATEPLSRRDLLFSCLFQAGLEPAEIT
jgi:hypothetical protein